MDVLSHALWGATIIRKKPLVWYAALFGALPDILGSGPGFLYLLVVRGIIWGTDTWQLMPEWTHDAYHLSHSLLGIAIVAIALACVGRRKLVLLVTYAFHVAIDLATHVTDPLARLLFPFVPWDAAHVIGMNWWESWWIIAANAGALLAVNMLLWRQKRTLPDR